MNSPKDVMQLNGYMQTKFQVYTMSKFNPGVRTRHGS